MAEKDRNKRFLRSVFSRAAKPEVVEEEEKQSEWVSRRTEEERPAEKTPGFDKLALTSAAELPTIKGNMLQVWQKWAGEKMSPLLSLVSGLSVEEIVFDQHQLEREAVRISLQLEQAARKRLTSLEKISQQEFGSLNAVTQAFVSQDKMMAWVFVFPPYGEGTLQLESIGAALREAKVTTGINQEVISRIFDEKLYFRIIPVAIGTPPVQGENGTVTELYERNPEREVMIDEEGMADYKYTNYVRQVRQGDVICELTLPVPGVPGVRVDGTVAEPKPVRPASPPRGANTRITDDGLQMVATIDGHLEFENQAFQVRPVLNIRGDVDYGTGNINFLGDVHVTGDVRENFSVTASGSITVDGLVEAARIEAGGDLLISRGVVGDNRAMIRSKGVVRVKYLENCIVYASRGVYADCVMNSQIFSDSFIEVCSGRGSVIGGALTAAQSIRAKMIGAKSGRKTELTLGVLPYVQIELQDIQEDLEANRKETDELDRQLGFLERQRGLEGSDARLAKARMRRSVLEMKEQQLLKRLEKLEPMMQDVSQCKLECNEIYPITTLTVREAVWTAREVKIRCKVYYSKEEKDLKETFW